MTKCKSFILYLLSAFIVGTILNGCDYHEFDYYEEDEPQGIDETIVNLRLQFDTSMPFYAEIVQTESRSLQASAWTMEVNEPMIRYIVRFFNYGAAADPENREPVRTFEFTRSVSQGFDLEVSVSMPQGKYECLVWADYVDADVPDADLFYLTDDFQEIILADRKNHIANTDQRDAYRGAANIVVDDQAKDIFIDMTRPMAKYEFITTDLSDFIAYAQAMMEAKEAQRAADAESAEGDAPAIPSEARDININDYTIMVRYNGYMPCSLNMFTDKPADAWTGVSYTGKALPQLASGEAQLGFDYVFVNGSEATVSAYIEVYDADGDVISRTSPIDIPLLRGHLTTIKGRFLTSHASGGATIDPDYEGEFNIQIN